MNSKYTNANTYYHIYTHNTTTGKLHTHKFTPWWVRAGAVWSVLREGEGRKANVWYIVSGGQRGARRMARRRTRRTLTHSLTHGFTSLPKSVPESFFAINPNSSRDEDGRDP